MLERIVYDADGQLQTGSLMDYAVPRADDMPPVELMGLHCPTQANLLGAKGVGEAGCIGVPAALLNAAADALSPWGEAELDFPLTSERLWRVMSSQ
jgi:carbon-monoxide dehydrogenase large subunit